MSDPIRFESLRRRPPVGTCVDLRGVSVQFVPDATGREYADVPAHLAHLLDAIPEGYQRAPEAPVSAPATTRTFTVPLLQPSPAGTEAPAGTDREGEGETNAPPPPVLADMDDDALRARFETELGRKPSPRAARETMIAQIEQHRAGAA